ncbi:MAG TPA: SIS domain-containing protein [Methylomirabilota bacterium]|jgi:glucosamine--fructose-6-phosphate aminotransferase (isomerizing)
MTTSVPAARAGHPYHMHDAIYAQPGALRLVGRGNEAALGAAAEALANAPHVVLAGTGSSWHAALVGTLLFARAGRLGPRVRAAFGGELADYGLPRDAGSALLGITHRGTRSVADALSAARAAGATSIAVTAKGPGTLGAELTLTTVDREASDTHTVSYTSALAVLAMLAAAVGKDETLGRAVDALPDQLALLLGQESWDEIGARFGHRRQYWFVGGGPNHATALEGALKVTEAAWVPALGFDAEQFLHGPWIAVDREDLLVVVAPPGPSRARCLAAARIARDAGAAVLALGAESDRELAALATEMIALPDVDERLSPIAAVVPLQLFAYHVAVGRGRNPDGRPLPTA